MCIASCFYVGYVQNSTVFDPLSRTPIRIGYAVEAPYAYLNAQNQVVGESPDIAKKMADCVGIPSIEWRLTEFSRLIPELNDGTIDIIASGMFVTPARMQQVDFSYVTFHVSESLLIKAGNPKALHQLQSFIDNPALKIAVISRSIEAQMLHTMQIPSAQIVLVPDALTGNSAIETGEVDALMLSTPSILWMQKHQRQPHTELLTLSRLSQQVQHGQGAFAFRKQDKALQTAWNNCLKPFIGSAEHLALVKPHGFDATQIPHHAAMYRAKLDNQP